MKRLIIIGALLYTVVTVLLTIFVLKPPQPIIEIKGEPLIQVADFGNEMLNFNITNTLLTAWIVTALLIVISLVATRRRAMIPSGFYNFVVGIAGEHNGRRFFPLICTLLIYIAFANWLSLTPVFNTFGMFVPLHAEEEKFHEEALVFKDGAISLIPFGAKDFELEASECHAGEEGDPCREEAIEHATEEHVGAGEKAGVLFPYLRGINTDLMTPLSFALVSVTLIQFWGVTTLGFFSYMKKFVNFSSPIDFFVGFLELIAEFAKLVSFSFRLFGNMLAGEILLLAMTFLIAVCSPILVIFYGLELFVGLIQAFVFAMLTLVFGALAVTSHDEHEEAHTTGGEAAAAQQTE